MSVLIIDKLDSTENVIGRIQAIASDHIKGKIDILDPGDKKVIEMSELSHEEGAPAPVAGDGHPHTRTRGPRPPRQPGHGGPDAGAGHGDVEGPAGALKWLIHHSDCGCQSRYHLARRTSSNA